MSAVQLLINFGGAISVYKPGQAAPFTTCTASWWVGLWNRYHITEWPLDAKFFGVRIQAGRSDAALRGLRE